MIVINRRFPLSIFRKIMGISTTPAQVLALPALGGSGHPATAAISQKLTYRRMHRLSSNQFGYMLLNHKFGKRSVIRILQFSSSACIVFAVVTLTVAILMRTTTPLLYYSGLSFFLIAFMAFLGKMYFLRLPVHGRGGPLTFDSTPRRYRFFFLALMAVCSSLIYSLLHSLM